MTEAPKSQHSACGWTIDEDTLGCCRVCEHTYHQPCFEQRLHERPWVYRRCCPDCSDLAADIPDVESLSYFEFMREVRIVRSSRAYEPSTSIWTLLVRASMSAHRRAIGSRTRATMTRRKTTAHTHRRRPKRRRTKTVIIEYEVQENGTVPVTRRVKRKLKKRRMKRRKPRTAPRRLMELATVRAALRARRAGPQQFAAWRWRAGIPGLSQIYGPRPPWNYWDLSSEGDEFGV